MSGAKKKLAQKEAMAQLGLTEKEKRALKEAAAKKRNTILGAILGVVVVVLVAALLVWNSGLIPRHTTALEVNGHKYSVADMDFFYRQYVNSAYQQEQSMIDFYQQQLGQEMSHSFDPTQDLTTQYVDEEKTQSYHEFFLEQTKDQVVQITALVDAAKAEGFTPDEETQETMDHLLSELDEDLRENNFSGRDAYFRVYFGRSVNSKVYEKNMKLSILANSYDAATRASLTEYTDDDLKAYYNENSALYNSYDYDYAYFDGQPVKETDDDGNTIEPTDEQKTEAMAAAKEKAEGLINAMKATPAEGENAPVFSNAAAVYGLSDTSRPRVLGTTVQNTVYGEWLMDSARKDGDIELFESEGNGYYVIQFHDAYFYDEPTVDVRHILAKAEMDEGAEEPTQAQMDAAHDEAEELMKQFNAMAPDEKTAEAFGELAEEHSDDGRNDDGTLYTKGGLYENIHKGDMVENFNNWIFDASRKEGDVGLVENAGPGYFGWHVIYFQATREPEWLTKVRTDKSNTDLTAWSESVVEGYEAVTTDAFNKVGL
ncbi:MAG: peptidyl-prolyl cis-trans isomerase [Oscillospiraceae bacterium]|jgi:hypothetical protein